MSSDYEDDELQCPKCGNFTRSRDCDNLFCNDGFIDLHEDDPLLFEEGEEEVCDECKGTGIIRWCPNCGEYLSGYHFINEEEE
jgi:hypothetical protein